MKLKPSQVLRNAAKGTSLAEIMLLLEPMSQTKDTNIVAMFVVDQVVDFNRNNPTIKEQNDFCRSLLIALAERYEKHNR